MAGHLLDKREEIISFVPIAPSEEHNTILIYATSSVFIFLAWTAVLLRFVTRIFVSRALGRDDWMILVTLVYHHMAPNASPNRF
jgi:hypothetical protein